MMAVLWNDIERDLASSRRHFGLAVEIFDAGLSSNEEKTYYMRTMAFMHAMLAGYISFEAAMKRLLSMLDEPVPTDFDWHTALVRRLANAKPGFRPAVLDSRALTQAVNGLRGFRHVATHVYDEFDEERATIAVRETKVFLAEIDPAIARFRAAIDPD